jgi:hypothetical protein
MEIQYGYFKQADARVIRQQELQQYTTAKDNLAQGKELLIPFLGDGCALIPTAHGLFRIGERNTKVHFPTINFESGLSCSSQSVCPFSFQNKRATKNTSIPLCYAQKLEGAYKSMFLSKAYQAEVCERIAQQAAAEDQVLIADAIAAATLGFGSKYVRLSEVGDIGPTVAPFAIRVIKSLAALHMKPYLYTKRPEEEYLLFQEAGAVVVVSERDFVCVKTEAAAKEKGLPICPGECGGPVHKCFRCPLGKQTAVIAH